MKHTTTATQNLTSARDSARILIVEDEGLIAMDIELQLKELGYLPVGIASCGQQAIDMANTLHPNLVLMDIQLSGEMDGIAAAQAIRDQFSIPVVFITAFAAEETLARAKLTEPYGYILKPFSEREMHTVIEMALYKHGADCRLKESLEVQRESALHTQAILDNMVDAVITISEKGLMESFNQAASAVFGYAAEEVLGCNVSMLMPAPHRDLHDGYVQHYRQTGEARIIGKPRELEGLRKDGSVFPMNLSVSKVVRGGRTTFVGLVLDISRRRQDEEEIRRLAFYDPVTGLPNRRLLLDHLRHAILASTRTGQLGVAMLLDLDNFKQINDSLGHTVGDELLLQVAKRLQSSVREGDSIARVGGDEFVVLLEALGMTDQEAAARAEVIAAKIVESLNRQYTLHGKHISCSCSIGIVVFAQDQNNIEELLKQADAAMYHAKAGGRNKACFFDPAIQSAAIARNALQDALRQGLARQQFLVHYQVQMDSDFNVQGAEALVRWAHPDRGMVSPAEFIPLAEEMGLILPLGQWVLETACVQLASWGKNPASVRWSVAVNVSALQFLSPDFVENVERALQLSGANPNLLKLELTESMLVGDVQQIIVNMNALKARGVSFSLDDFGTGYSSLSYLKRLPLSQLKIDQSFVRDLLIDPNDKAIASTIVSLGHSLGLKVIAEGVETLEQRDMLAMMGCDAFQGYYFGRPAPPDQLIKQS